MIEPRGAKHAYLSMIKARRGVGLNVSMTHTMMFDVADSEDEAFGRAMRAGALMFPQERGWYNHYVLVTEISGIDWVGRYDFTKIEPMT